MSFTETELYWAAGFLEGEGSFVASSAACRTRPERKTVGVRLSAIQVQMEPLERLQRMFGGNIRPHTHREGQSPLLRWEVNGNRAVALMFTLWSIMSPRRKQQIETAIAKWKLNRSHKEGCKEGAVKGWITRRAA